MLPGVRPEGKGMGTDRRAPEEVTEGREAREASREDKARRETVEEDGGTQKGVTRQRAASLRDQRGKTRRVGVARLSPPGVLGTAGCLASRHSQPTCSWPALCSGSCVAGTALGSS